MFLHSLCSLVFFSLCPKKKMKGMDIFCSSSASTAVRSSTVHHSGRRSFDLRQNPRAYTPSSSFHHIPIIPLPLQKSRRSSAGDDLRRKSCADVSDLRSSSHGSSSSRYLLSDHKPFMDDNYIDRASALIPVIQEQPISVKTKHVISSTGFSPALKSSSSARPRDQVVVLRVSLHCKGCEGKVRKHISKMEGVTSFSIDLETKKVTVVGDVTPLGVLNSISKVKKAQLWPPPPSSSCSSAPSTPTPSVHHSHARQPLLLRN